MDFSANREWLENLSRIEHRQDALVVAGDIAHQTEKIAVTFELLQERFSEVFFVPGNHELWVRGETGDSLDKFARILDLCHRGGVHTRMHRGGDWWIAPLFSWYSARFDSGDRGSVSALSAWGDFRYCRWPEEVGELDSYFSGFNDGLTRPRSGRVLTFSHFLPRIELLPDPVYLRFKGLPKVAGSTVVESQLRALGSELHVFGHSHISWDETIDGVRYRQHQLGYPQERRDRKFALAQVA